jgi:hypothetical protein
MEMRAAQTFNQLHKKGKVVSVLDYLSNNGRRRV